MTRTFAPTIGYRALPGRLAALRGLAPLLGFFEIAWCCEHRLAPKHHSAAA